MRITNLDEYTDHLMAQGKIAPGNFQVHRDEYWSLKNYAAAGAVSFAFFADAQDSGGDTGEQLTNLPKSGQLLHPFYCRSIELGYWVDDELFHSAWGGDDADTLAADKLMGLFNAGVLEVKVGGTIITEIPKPFEWCAPGDGGALQIKGAGIHTLALSEAAPNTLSTVLSAPPAVHLTNAEGGGMRFAPGIPIDDGVNFSVRLRYREAIAVIATDVEDSSTNKLYIGAKLKGFTIRPRN